MGDSYSAGPGAGDMYDDFRYGDNKCFRGKGAYGPKLDALHDEKLGNFQFLSCTGHKTKDVVQYQFPDLRWAGQNAEMTVLLSIGGNDLKFSKYIKACLIGIPGTVSCNPILKRAALFSKSGTRLVSIYGKIRLVRFPFASTFQ